MVTFIQNNEETFLKDLEGLIAIDTTLDETSTFPFGDGVRAGFDYLITIAKREGLAYKDVDGHAIHIEYGQGPLIGILCHIDTVGIYYRDQWLTDPFKMTLKDGILYGRGVNDNKGPLMACLHLLIAMKQNNVNSKNKIRLIIGGAEETSWEGIRHYFKHEEMPELGISPDGNFPIVNIEKGVRFYKIRGRESHSVIEKVHSEGDISKVCKKTYVKDIFGENTYLGIEAPSRHPLKGENSILKMISNYNHSLNVFDQIQSFYEMMNKDNFTCNISSFEYSNDNWCVDLDIRWEHDIVEHEIDNIVRRCFGDDFLVRKESKSRLYVAPTDPFITSLKKAYKAVFNEEASLLTKGGASYARVLKKGIAFGPCLPGEVSHQHQPNERQSLEGLYKALEVYVAFLKELDTFYETKNHGDNKSLIGVRRNSNH